MTLIPLAAAASFLVPLALTAPLFSGPHIDHAQPGSQGTTVTAIADPPAAPSQFWKFTTTGLMKCGGFLANATPLFERSVETMYYRVDGQSKTWRVTQRSECGTRDKVESMPLRKPEFLVFPLREKVNGPGDVSSGPALKALPTNPASLREHLYRVLDGYGSKDTAVFNSFSGLLGLKSPVALRAAALEVLPTVGGVTLSGPEALPSGVSATVYSQVEAHQRFQWSLLVEPSSGTVSGERVVAHATVPGQQTAGDLLLQNSMVRSVVDEVPAEVISNAKPLQ